MMRDDHLMLLYVPKYVGILLREGELGKLNVTQIIKHNKVLVTNVL